MITCFRLCKSGFASSVAEAAEMDVRTVLQALEYEGFLADYERAYYEMNKSEG